MGLLLPFDKLEYPELDPLAPTNRGLVGFWPLADGRGNMARDLCKPGNHSSLINFGSSYPWVPKADGPRQALAFTRASSHYVSPGAVIVDWANANDFSLATRFNATDITLTQGLLSQRNAGNGSVLYLSGSKLTFWNAKSLTSPATLLSNTEYDVAITHPANGALTMYINGVSVATEPSPGTMAHSSNFDIGRFDGSNYFGGSQSAVRLHNCALTPAEVYCLSRDRWIGTLQDHTTDYRIASAGGNTPLTVTLGQASWVGTGFAPGTDFRLGVTPAQSQWSASGFAPLTDFRLGQTLGQALWSWTGRPLSGLGAAAATLGLFPVRGSKENLRGGSRRGGTDAT